MVENTESTRQLKTKTNLDKYKNAEQLTKHIHKTGIKQEDINDLTLESVET